MLNFLQLNAAMFEIHEIFFEMPIKDRMNIVSQSRALERERQFKHQVLYFYSFYSVFVN